MRAPSPGASENGQQGHGHLLRCGMWGPSWVLALAAAGALLAPGSQHTGSAMTRVPAHTQRHRGDARMGVPAHSWCCPVPECVCEPKPVAGQHRGLGQLFLLWAEGFCVALLLLQKQIWAAELMERISEH